MENFYTSTEVLELMTTFYVGMSSPDPVTYLSSFEVPQPYAGHWDEAQKTALEKTRSLVLVLLSEIDAAIANALQAADIAPFGARFIAVDLNRPMLLALPMGQESDEFIRLLSGVVQRTLPPAPQEEGLYLSVRDDVQGPQWLSARAAQIRGNGPMLIFGPIARNPVTLALAMAHEACHRAKDESTQAITSEVRRAQEKLALESELQLANALRAEQFEGDRTAIAQKLQQEQTRIQHLLRTLE